MFHLPDCGARSGAEVGLERQFPGEPTVHHYQQPDPLRVPQVWQASRAARVVRR